MNVLLVPGSPGDLAVAVTRPVAVGALSQPPRAAGRLSVVKSSKRLSWDLRCGLADAKSLP